MKALIYLGPGRLELVETERPRGDVVIRVAGTGVCGTDLKTYVAGHPMFQPPTILGHECYGRIEELAAPLGDWKIGDTVAVAPYLECGVCEKCRSGVGELCERKSYLDAGCFAEFVSMPARHAARALAGVGDGPEATLIEPLACVLNGYGRLRRPPRRMLIVGGGPMGTLFALCAREMGCEATVVETSPWRADFIGKLGIPVRFSLPEDRYDTVVMAVNKTELATKAVASVADGGSMLLFSGYPSGSGLSVDPHAIHYREVTVTGSFGFASGHWAQAVEAVRKEPAGFARLISHRFPLERAVEAFHLLRDGRAMKIVLG